MEGLAEFFDRILKDHTGGLILIIFMLVGVITRQAVVARRNSGGGSTIGSLVSSGGMGFDQQLESQLTSAEAKLLAAHLGAVARRVDMNERGLETLTTAFRDYLHQAGATTARLVHVETLVGEMNKRQQDFHEETRELIRELRDLVRRVNDVEDTSDRRRT